MNKNSQHRKKFFEEQLQCCEEQDSILEKIEIKLHEMKEIAHYAYEHDLNFSMANKLNNQLNVLKNVVHTLQKQLHTMVH